MSLLTVLLAIVAMFLALVLIGGAAYAASKIGWSIPPWAVNLAYVLIVVVTVLFLCDRAGLFRLLASVRI
jgi:hypothetical protein